MHQVVDSILLVAEEDAGYYDGRLKDLLPWTFWLTELATPAEDIRRMVRVWNGDYLECLHFGEGVDESYVYVFRDGLGVGHLGINSNMALLYLRYFLNAEHSKISLGKLRDPRVVTRGLPDTTEITGLDIPSDSLIDLFEIARSIAAEYVTGQDYSESVAHLGMFFKDLAEASAS